MSQRMKLFIFLLIINLIVVVFYLIWNYIRRKEKIGSVWMKAVMMLLCPVTGPAFVFLSFLLFKLFSSQGMDLSDVVFNKDRTENFLRPDEEMERNMVSLEEALEVTDKKSLRTLMLNVIRGDYRNSLAAINLALNSEDSETAHYAASVLQDVLNDFRSKVQTDYLLCQEENEQQVENCIKLVEYMNPILEQQVLTNLEQRSMAERMQEVLQKAWELDKIKISSTIYEKVCQRLFSVQHAVLKRDHHFIKFAEQRHEFGNTEFLRVNANRAAGDAVVAGSLVRLTDKVHLEGGRIPLFLFRRVPLVIFHDALFIFRLALVGIQVGLCKIPLDMIE